MLKEDIKKVVAGEVNGYSTGPYYFLPQIGLKLESYFVSFLSLNEGIFLYRPSSVHYIREEGVVSSVLVLV